MPETPLLTPARPRTAIITIAVGAVLGLLVTAGISAAAPAVAASLGRAAVSDSEQLGVGMAEADAAVTTARAALTNAATVVVDASSAEVDLGAESIAVDTADLLSTLGSLAEGDADAILQRPALTAGLTEQTALMTAQATALRERLNAAIAQQQAEAAAVAALTAANTPEGARNVARQIAADQYGWGDDQFSCLNSLWNKESGWDYQAYNSGGGATGIPQSLPGNKMASFGDDWATNGTTQIRWGLDYIQRAYGAPCSAWGHSQSVNWY
ncbi:phospholipase [Microbacterium sp. A93]|uniref:aggregation-promoting factor C-terminal-like domain-containing protein n=1 Tax=Microbacterium sp. A93 TaxID=3450716 RepID=UPI003F428803